MAVAGVAVAVLAASPPGCAADRSSPTSTAPAATPSSEPTAGEAVPTDPAGVVRVRLLIGNDVATATLEDSAAARAFAMLPMTIDTGLEVMAAAGNDFQMTIEPLD